MDFRCYICGFEFGRRFNLNRHIASQHLSSCNRPKNIYSKTNASSANPEQVERLKWFCSAILDLNGGENGDLRKEVAHHVLNDCVNAGSDNRFIQLGRGLSKQPIINTDEENIDDQDGSDISESDNSESDNYDSVSSTETDEEIKSCMADMMYICCQRPEKRRDMLENANVGIIKCICTCAKDVLTGEIPINYNEKDTLEKHKDVLRKLSDPSKTTQEKREIIVQNGGGFLLSLIPTVVGAIAALLQ